MTFAAALVKNSDLVYRHDRPGKKLAFPSQALRRIPIKFILSFTEHEPSLRHLIYPAFLAATSNILPELLIFETIPTSIKHTRRKTVKNFEQIVSDFERKMSEKDFHSLSSLVAEMEKLDDLSILHFWSTDRVFRHVRNPDTPRWLLVSLKRLWLRLHNIIPRKLRLKIFLNY